MVSFAQPTISQSRIISPQVTLFGANQASSICISGAITHDDARAAGRPKFPLFPTLGRSSEQLTGTSLSRRNALDMVKRRARQAGVQTAICNHSFRGTGITTYLENGGELEKAAHMVEEWLANCAVFSTWVLESGCRL